jgi:hypothetical protein
VDQTELDAILTETAERGPFVQTAAELSKKIIRLRSNTKPFKASQSWLERTCLP